MQDKGSTWAPGASGLWTVDSWPMSIARERVDLHPCRVINSRVGETPAGCLFEDVDARPAAAWRTTTCGASRRDSRDPSVRPIRLPLARRARAVREEIQRRPRAGPMARKRPLERVVDGVDPGKASSMTEPPPGGPMAGLIFWVGQVGPQARRGPKRRTGGTWYSGEYSPHGRLPRSPFRARGSAPSRVGTPPSMVRRPRVSRGHFCRSLSGPQHAHARGGQMVRNFRGAGFWSRLSRRRAPRAQRKQPGRRCTMQAGG